MYEVSAQLTEFNWSQDTADDNFQQKYIVLWLAGLYFMLIAWFRGFNFLFLSHCPSFIPLALAVPVTHTQQGSPHTELLLYALQRYLNKLIVSQK